MRKLFLFLFVFSFAMLAKAQFGYYSSSNIMHVMPSYKQAVADYERLCQRCEKEIEHNERELTRKYVAFLDGYRDFPEPILRKRQNELQQLVDNSINFRKELKTWLAEAKDSLFATSYNAVAEAVEKVSVACDLDYVIDTDMVAYKYINPAKAVDITVMLLDAALNPDKPATALDGYEEYMRAYMPNVLPVRSADADAVVECDEDVATDVENAAVDDAVLH
ncbi:MAG: OmpH family outer membrane protein [Bacteroidaceae bacterium]|nr:OmpH family outer membrane protein [Bacteroidaceae bacterium]